MAFEMPSVVQMGTGKALAICTVTPSLIEPKHLNYSVNNIQHSPVTPACKDTQKPPRRLPPLRLFSIRSNEKFVRTSVIARPTAGYRFFPDQGVDMLIFEILSTDCKSTLESIASIRSEFNVTAAR
ncbi:hypothetical protein [Glutamicibacter arilaitensis]|uniref:hypothetical protein n=1 Tax=Glutamicibacter arilaitensis TaxID=256701 RepID=UPI003FD4B08B